MMIKVTSVLLALATLGLVACSNNIDPKDAELLEAARKEYQNLTTYGFVIEDKGPRMNPSVDQIDKALASGISLEIIAIKNPQQDLSFFFRWAKGIWSDYTGMKRDRFYYEKVYAIAKARREYMNSQIGDQIGTQEVNTKIDQFLWLKRAINDYDIKPKEIHPGLTMGHLDKICGDCEWQGSGALIRKLLGAQN